MKCPILEIGWMQTKVGEKGGRANMFCPLLWIAKPEVEIGLSSELDCLKKECAWWNSHNNECCLISTGKVLNAISTYLYEIKEKMPHKPNYIK